MGFFRSRAEALMSEYGINVMAVVHASDGAVVSSPPNWFAQPADKALQAKGHGWHGNTILEAVEGVVRSLEEAQPPPPKKPRVVSTDAWGVVVTLPDGSSAKFAPMCEISVEVAKRLKALPAP